MNFATRVLRVLLIRAINFVSSPGLAVAPVWITLTAWWTRLNWVNVFFNAYAWELVLYSIWSLVIAVLKEYGPDLLVAIRWRRKR